jgi:hypothetical protein
MFLFYHYPNIVDARPSLKCFPGTKYNLTQGA